MTVGTYLLYGCEVCLNPVPDKFSDADEYIDYLYDVLNNNTSSYKIIYEDNSSKFYFGYVIDKACDSDEYVQYFNSTSITQCSRAITPEVFESLEWLFLVYFNKKIEDLIFDFYILTTYY